MTTKTILCGVRHMLHFVQETQVNLSKVNVHKSEKTTLFNPFHYPSYLILLHQGRGYTSRGRRWCLCTKRDLRICLLTSLRGSGGIGSPRVAIVVLFEPHRCLNSVVEQIVKMDLHFYLRSLRFIERVDELT